MKIVAAFLLVLLFVLPAVAQDADIEKIMFVTADEAAETSTIMIADPDGTNAQPFLTSEGIYSPVWSPDGRHLAFAATTTREHRAGIYVIDSDGTNLRKISTQAGEAGSPVWSPDSTQLMYAVYLGYGQKNDLYRVNLDGTEAQKISFPSDAMPFFLQETWLAWSPDGEQIAFHTTDEINYSYDGILYSAEADGSNPQPFPTASQDGRSFHHLNWSPDEQQVLLTFYNGMSSGHDILAVANADGTNLREIQGAARNIWGGVWSPDGSQILFAANEAGNDFMPDLDLWVVNADGSNLHPLKVGIYVTYQSPAWGLLPADVVLPTEAIILEEALEQ